MRLFYLPFSFLLFAVQLSGQCPMGTVILDSQEAINTFVITYPNCTEISGDFVLGQNYGANEAPLDLSSLSNINSVQGTLQILNTGYYDQVMNQSYPGSLSGLENITSVKNLIVGNQGGIGSPIYLSTIVSLEPLNNISGSVDTLWLGNFVSLNSVLPDFSSVQTLDYFRQVRVFGVSSTPIFPSLTAVRDFTVGDTPMSDLLDTYLTTIIVPDNLTEVAFSTTNPPYNAGFYIFDNPSLIEIVGGESLTDIFGEITIMNNSQLSIISGFDNVQTVSDGYTTGVDIQACKPQAFNVLKNLHTTNNLRLKFNSQPDDGQCSEFAEAVTFRTGEDADYLRVAKSARYNAFNVNEVVQTGNLKSAGGLSIYTDIATSFTGFQALDSIIPAFQTSGGLEMTIPNLIQLPNFSNLTYIGAGLRIDFGNNQPGQLINLQGLNALKRVGLISIMGSSALDNSLTSLDGLENIDSITNGLKLQYLLQLNDISALSTELNFAGSLSIKNNPSLESCAEFEVFCNLLSQATDYIQISSNGLGCNDPDSLLTSCVTGIDDHNLASLNAWFGKSNQINLNVDLNSEPYELRIFNILGQEVFHSTGVSTSGNMSIELNKSLKTGIYILEYKTENRRTSRTVPYIE